MFFPHYALRFFFYFHLKSRVLFLSPQKNYVFFSVMLYAFLIFTQLSMPVTLPKKSNYAYYMRALFRSKSPTMILYALYKTARFGRKNCQHNRDA